MHEELMVHLGQLGENVVCEQDGDLIGFGVEILDIYRCFALEFNCGLAPGMAGDDETRSS